jgi:uncharacterized protein YkwD
MRIALLALLVFAAPLVAQSAVDSQPSASEQYAIYIINRARHNPQTYDTEQSLGGILAGITPSPPLAIHLRLITSSRFHSNEMGQNGYFAHQSAVTSQWPNQMERNAGYPLKSSFPNTSNNVESIACTYTTGSSISYSAQAAIRALIEDSGVSPPGHRYHLLAWGGNSGEIAFYRQFREIGTGYATGYAPTGTPLSGAGAYWAIHTGVRDADAPWITGVVYNDANSNGLYDQGEGLAGVSVSSGTSSATSNSQGGYSIQVAAGSFNMSCSGGSFVGTATGVANVSTDNVEVDFKSGVAAADINFGGGSIGGPGPGGSSNSDSASGGCSTDESAAWFATLLSVVACGLFTLRLRRAA